MFQFVLSLKSLIAIISQSLSSLALVALNRGCITYTPSDQDMALYVKERFHSFRQSKLECSCHESCVFRICSRINNFYVYDFYRNPGHAGSLYDCLLDSTAHHSEWMESVSPTDRHLLLLISPTAFDFYNLSGCEQFFAVPLTLLVTDSILYSTMNF